jgi:arylsulfatase A-like enzyme
MRRVAALKRIELSAYIVPETDEVMHSESAGITVKKIVISERIDAMPSPAKGAREAVLAFALCLAAIAASGKAHATEDPPNILLVIADDMGVDASPCYPVGDQKPNMPVLENMCRTGVVFENVWSNPECSPTRATILTGRYGFRTGVTAAVLKTGGTGIRLDELSIQRLLDQRLDNRYAHAVFGKWHLSDRDNGGINNPGLMGVGHYAGIMKNGDYWRWNRTEDGQTQEIEGYATTVFTDEAIDWVSEQEQPWFLWLAYTAPHDPFHLPPAELHTRRDLSGDSLDIAVNPLPYYLAMMEAMDSELGRFLASLRADERENTIVIFVGDNGTPSEVVQSPYDDYRAKSTIFEGGIHVPMIVAGAGVTRRGEREAALINTTDLFATIADVAGTGITRSGDSISFRYLLNGTSGSQREFVYAEFHDEYRKWRNGWAIRDERFKLVKFGSGRRLFDLIKDPFEKQDLLYPNPTPDAQETAESLARAAARLREE